jgi:hypothetical protein
MSFINLKIILLIKIDLKVIIYNLIQIILNNYNYIKLIIIKTIYNHYKKLVSQQIIFKKDFIIIRLILIICKDIYLY